MQMKEDDSFLLYIYSMPLYHSLHTQRNLHRRKKVKLQ